jgi:hypothetical protein
MNYQGEERGPLALADKQKEEKVGSVQGVIHFPLSLDKWNGAMTAR